MNQFYRDLKLNYTPKARDPKRQGFQASDRPLHELGAYSLGAYSLFLSNRFRVGLCTDSGPTIWRLQSGGLQSDPEYPIPGVIVLGLGAYILGAYSLGAYSLILSNRCQV